MSFILPSMWSRIKVKNTYTTQTRAALLDTSFCSGSETTRGMNSDESKRTSRFLEAPQTENKSVSKRGERETEKRDQLYVGSKRPETWGLIRGGPAKCWQHPPWHPMTFQQGAWDWKSKISEFRDCICTQQCMYKNLSVYYSVAFFISICF